MRFLAAELDTGMAEKSLNECNDLTNGPVERLDPKPTNCPPLGVPTLNDVPSTGLHQCPKREGLGREANCNPIQWGLIVDDPKRPYSRETINRYSQALRGCDEAMRDLFSSVSVIDDNGQAHRVPVTVAAPEKAVAYILQQNVRKDDTLVVDRIRLPLLSLHNKTNITLNQQRYVYSGNVDWLRGADGKPGWVVPGPRNRGTVLGRTRGLPVDISYQLSAWTLYQEDMNQILEQIFLKFDPIAYIRVQDVPYETIVRLDSTANNSESEPGDRAVRVIKWQFNMTVETYIPQPIVRKQTVLDIRADILHGVDESDIQEVLKKFRVSTEGEA